MKFSISQILKILPLGFVVCCIGCQTTRTTVSERNSFSVNSHDRNTNATPLALKYQPDANLDGTHINKDTRSIMKSYLSDVNTRDGIDKKEAVILAQSEIIFRGKSMYDFAKPEIIFDDTYVWAIRFGQTDTSENIEPHAVIYINRTTGNIRFKEKSIL